MRQNIRCEVVYFRSSPQNAVVKVLLEMVHVCRYYRKKGYVGVFMSGGVKCQFCVVVD